MTEKLRLTLAQLNPTVGDLAGNMAKAQEAHAAAAEAGADMLVLPEMFITGYQTQDLVMRPAFALDAMEHVLMLAKACDTGPAIGVGAPLLEDDLLFNAYYILRGGEIVATLRKHELPNTHVFDEVRQFSSGPIAGPYNLGNVRIGTPICEDAWHVDVPEALAESGAEILVVPNGSPYYRNKYDRRFSAMVSRVIENDLPLVYLNMVGGQDDQVFDGGSFVLNRGGQLAMQMPLFDEAIAHVDFEKGPEGWEALDGEKIIPVDEWEQDYRVMTQGLRDYMGKTGFKKVLLGLSGGIDSAIVATIAVDALGAENVRCVMLPSEYTAQNSLDDAAELAANLGVKLDTIPIAKARAAVTETMAPFFKGMEPDVTEENIQSRLRGLLLMSLSNKFGEMLLTTGNKSEVAVGYATIYGDMSGGYNPIKDLYKMRVFESCRWRNANHRDWMMGPKGAVIPVNIIDKPPTAELREDQKDSDSLPEYEELDAILELLVDQDLSVAEIVALGFDRAVVKRIEHLVYISEYKRFQSAPGPRLTHRAFWMDRRYPIVNRWRDTSGEGL
ncbi:NAD+ synthase [Neptunicoccus cionae]|uniref:Glutamine-dependent NAD(+) synthetase n=1 Tax=Neptunicoccus cionae TaxID=2035344 RepID=A0A916QSC4_9RHOB|nr:NAD+ synthase [Amylibacter cionae]GGA08368.1 NAD+ synthase [Amylibacter cionae]